MGNPFKPNVRLVQVFVALQIIGVVSFILILFSAIIAQRRGANRHPTFFSFCCNWIVFCISYSVLFFAGQQFDLPDYSLCVTQAALIYSAPPLAGSATVCVVTHLLLNITSALSKSPIKQKSSIASAALVIAPWLIWITFFIGFLQFGLQRPRIFVRKSFNGTYCVLGQTDVPKLTSAWATAASALCIIEEIVLAIVLYRNRYAMVRFRQSATMALRVCIFTVALITAIVLASIFMTTNKHGVEFDVLVASVPLFGAVIFGSQKDLLRVWIFWKRYDPAEGTGNRAVISTVALTTVVSTTSEDSDKFDP